MPGRHAAPGYGGFMRELGIFVLKVAFWAAVVFGGVLLFQNIFGSDEAGSTTTSTASTTTTQATTTTVATTTTTVATTTTTTVETTTTTTEATTTTVTGLDPAELTVLVLNATQRSGLAAELTARLAELGYQTLEPDNWETPFEVSRVWYVEGFEVEAARLAGDLVPDGIVELFQGVTQADIIVVLGASFQG